MIADGYTGRKGKGGFYRLNRAGGGKRQGSDRPRDRRLSRPERKAELDGGQGSRQDLRELLDALTTAWPLCLARDGADARLCRVAGAEAADDIAAIDEAMRLGYNWKMRAVRADRQDRRRLVRRPAGSGRHARCRRCCGAAQGKSFYRVEDGKRQALGARRRLSRRSHAPRACCCSPTSSCTAKPVLKNGSAALWDIGDGVLCFEFTSKMNSLDAEIIALLEPDHRTGAEAVQGAGDLQRGHEFLGRRQSRPRRCSPPTSPPGARSRSSSAPASRPTRR